MAFLRGGLESKVMGVGGDTYANPIVQKVLQNQPSFPNIGIPTLGLAKKCQNLTFKVNFFFNWKYWFSSTFFVKIIFW